MTEPNQFAISRELGSRISAGDTPSFGRLGLLPLVAHAHGPVPVGMSQGRLDGRYDELIKRAFGAVAAGLSADRLLADPSLARAFDHKAKELGIAAPPALIRKRLLRMRKSGGRLPKTTIKERVPSIEPHNAFAIEYSVVRLSRLFGATVDDILCDESLAGEFQTMVGSLAPQCSPLTCRLGALYLRKSRHTQSSRRHLIEQLHPSSVNDRWLDLGTINEIASNALAGVNAGILRVDEAERSLYISRSDAVAEMASTFINPFLWDRIANHFWHPHAAGIRLKVLPASAVSEPLEDWELRLIQLIEPVFNMRVTARAA
ncbi:MAG: hypothetical protein HUU22_06770 [Phycisphaerae bacterium]|nr:hypothetical protein [Phycisphaerae bacterium]NUQ45717.1 hypothetical protein [Phycisphaerae bacterium]